MARINAYTINFGHRVRSTSDGSNIAMGSDVLRIALRAARSISIPRILFFGHALVGRQLQIS